MSAGDIFTALVDAYEDDLVTRNNLLAELVPLDSFLLLATAKIIAIVRANRDRQRELAAAAGVDTTRRDFEIYQCERNAVVAEDMSLPVVNIWAENTEWDEHEDPRAHTGRGRIWIEVNVASPANADYSSMQETFMHCMQLTSHIRNVLAYSNYRVLVWHPKSSNPCTRWISNMEYHVTQDKDRGIAGVVGRLSVYVRGQDRVIEPAGEPLESAYIEYANISTESPLSQEIDYVG